MMRMRVAVADEVPLLIGRDTDKIDALDELPRCIGDQAEEGHVIGKLGLKGATRPLASRKNRRFECYEGDGKPLTLPDVPWDGDQGSFEDIPERDQGHRQQQPDKSNQPTGNDSRM